MYFFLSAGIGQNLTGIEHAILKRKKIFDACSLSHKIVTINFNPNYFDNLSLHGIDKGSFLNLYDFYQDLIFKESVSNRIEDYLLKIAGNSKIESQTGSKDVKVFINDIYLFYIHFFDNGQISYINFFDVNRVKFKREIYTETGYLCKVIYLENNKQKNINYLNSKGDVFLEENYDGENKISLITLYYNNKKNYFKDKNDFIKFWFKSIICLYRNPIFYSDKNKLYNEILLEIKSTDFKLISVFHSVHVSDPKEMDTGRINSNYQISLNRKESFDGFIVSTIQQKKDLMKRFGENLKVWVIPPTYADIDNDKLEEDKLEEDKPFTLISVGRYYIEKRLHHIIEATQLLKVKYPTIRLNLFGFGDSRDNFNYEKKIRKYVVDHQLENNVFFMGYVHNISDCIREARVSVVTSTIEGFCIGILDSLAVGTPVVAYDIKYGPKDMIEDNYSGYLVEEENIEQLAKAIEKCYLEPDMRLKAKQSAQKYSLESNKKSWLNHVLELSNV